MVKLMKVGDEAYTNVSSLFDIHKVQIKRETPKFFIFEFNGKEVRRKKTRFCETKQELLENKLRYLEWNLQVQKTNPQEIYETYKMITEEYPEILI